MEKHSAPAPRDETEKQNGRLGDVRIGSGDESRAEFRPGERVWIDVEGFVAPAVRRAVLGFAVRDIRGYNLFGYSTFYANFTLVPAKSGRVAGRFSFDCNLTSGDYSITIRLEDYLSDAMRVPIEKRVNAAIFKVVDDEKKFQGVVDLAGSFENRT